MSGTSKRVPGHALVWEGRPFRSGHTTGLVVAGRHWWLDSDGVGLCECGATSAYGLPSDAARKRWHREHKARVLQAAEAQP